MELHTLFRLGLAAAVGTALACLVAPVSAAPPGGGTTIENRATLGYFHSGINVNIAITSAPVRALIAGATTPSLTKSVSPATAGAGQTAQFTLAAQLGNPAPGVFPATINGVPTTMIVVRDVLPAGTRWVSFDSFTGAGTPLYHRTGDPAHVYATTPPVLAQLDAIALGIASPTPNSTAELTFTVEIETNAPASISNTGELYYDDGVSPTPVRLPSNPVTLGTTNVPPPIPPTLNYFANGTFGSPANVSSIGAPLYLQATAPACNLSPVVIETNVIVITSALTGDRETILVVETGPNTGVFRPVSPVPTSAGVAVSGNGVVNTRRNDSLTAELAGCGGTRTTTVLLIDPAGVVFDSQSNVPIPGARVVLWDVNAGVPAGVFQADGTTPAPNTIVTGPDGRYEFPAVAPGNYRLIVTPPPGYNNPSTVPTFQLPAGRTVSAIGGGSYGGVFPVNAQTGAVTLDYPLDPAPGVGNGLFLQKTASRSTAEIGDFVDYTIRIRNVSGGALTPVTVADRLPQGFSYHKGSARLEGTPLADPTGSGGAQLNFNAGTIPDGATVTLTYRVRLGPGAMQGNGVNQAQAYRRVPGLSDIVSNVATARVQLQPGVFTDKGVILGKVFVDANTNRVQDIGEVGVPGIRLYLEDGTYAITDSEGKYNFYGISPRTHVVKLDTYTLPKGARLERLSTRNASDAGSLFVELKRGELHKADFALLPPTPAVLQEIRQRRAAADKTGDELARGTKSDLTRDGVPLPTSDPKSLPASGVIGGPTGSTPAAAAPARPPANGGTRTNGVTQQARVGASATNPPNFSAVLPAGTLNGANSPLPAVRVATPIIKLEQVMTNLDNTLGFVDFKNGDVLPAPQSNVRVKGLQGARFSLSVNGVLAPASRVGKRAVHAARKSEAWEFVGMAFKPGTNTLTLNQRDAGGNLRGSTTIHVIAPDKLGDIKLLLPKNDQPADGKTLARVIVLLQDAKGLPVTARTPITLETTAGEWKVADLNKTEPGTQVFLEGGQGEYELIPPQEPVDARIVASSGAMQVEATLPFLPDLRPLIAAGVLEGRLHLNNFNAGSIISARSRDGFEEEIRSWSTGVNGGKQTVSGRAAFFLKGKIKGDYLLTAGYDSDKDSKERLFRDIQPDEFYPVYGDSSVKGFDAQSTGRLYVRIDKRKSYLLYGDLITSGGGESRSLGNYSRSLTGVREHYETKHVSANAWASRDSTRQVIEEMRGNGTSGPYLFSTANGLLNSEKVEILTRDRNQPNLILQSVPMARFTDYEFEPFTGRILFKAPVPSLDANLNPVSVRVTYEVDQGGEKFWVYGADAQVKLHERVEVGGAAVRDENPQGKLGLYSGNATLRLAKRTYLMGEYARSDAAGTPGNAGRVELRHQSGGTEARVYYGKSDNTFSNQASVLGAGRVEAGAKVSQKIAQNTRAVGQAIHTESTGPGGGSRKGVTAGIEHTFKNQMRVEVGGRYSTETANPAGASTATPGLTPNEVTSVRGKFTTPVPFVKGAAIYGELENDVVQPDNRMVAVGGEYQIGKTRVYARHEFINALGGPYELNNLQQQNTTVIGLDTEYIRDGHLFNEYRMRDAVAGRESEAATGLRNGWNVSEGLRLHTSFERTTPIDSGPQNEATAVAGGLEYTRNPDWKLTTRLELRTATANDSLLHTFGYARKLSTDWTFLGRSIVYLVEGKGPDAGDRQQARLQGGLAWRQTEENRWNALGKYEYKTERDSTQAALQLDRDVHILSLHANYQPHADWQLSGRYAGKLATERSNGQEDSYDAHLLAGLATYELTRWLDIGLNGSVLFSGDTRSFHYGIGPELGVTLKRNLRLGVGYNFFGFTDRDLGAEDYTQRGVYISLRLKFDESLMGLRKEEKP